MGATDSTEIVNIALRKIGQKKISSLGDTTDTTAVKANDVYLPLLRKLLREHPWTFATLSVILGHVVDGTAKTITAATAANPVVITSASHGFSDDDVVSITSVIGMVELNGRKFTVQNKTTNTFELKSEDGSSHTTYTSAGTVGVVSVVGSEIDFDNRYALPSDYLKKIKVIGEPEKNMPHRLQSNGSALELVSNETQISIRYIAKITTTTQFDDTFVHVFSLLLASELAFTISQSRSMASQMRVEYLNELARAKGLNAQEGGTPTDISARQNDVLESRE